MALDASKQRALTRLRDRLADLPRHRRALELAISSFGDDFDETAFTAAAKSQEAKELAKANAVQAAFENTHNHLIGIAESVVQLLGGTGDEDALTCLRKLKNEDLITERTRAALADAQRVRSRLQHAYDTAAASELHEAASLVRGHVQTYLDDVSAWLRQAGYAKPAQSRPVRMPE